MSLPLARRTPPLRRQRTLQVPRSSESAAASGRRRGGAAWSVGSRPHRAWNVAAVGKGSNHCVSGVAGGLTGLQYSPEMTAPKKPAMRPTRLGDGRSPEVAMGSAADAPHGSRPEQVYV